MGPPCLLCSLSVPSPFQTDGFVIPNTTRVDFGVIWERCGRGSMTQATVPGLRPGVLPVLLMGLRQTSFLPNL